MLEYHYSLQLMSYQVVVYTKSLTGTDNSKTSKFNENYRFVVMIQFEILMIYNALIFINYCFRGLI